MSFTRRQRVEAEALRGLTLERRYYRRESLHPPALDETITVLATTSECEDGQELSPPSYHAIDESSLPPDFDAWVEIQTDVGVGRAIQVYERVA